MSFNLMFFSNKSTLEMISSMSLFGEADIDLSQEIKGIVYRPGSVSKVSGETILSHPVAYSILNSSGNQRVRVRRQGL